jgi:hypothetical protein
MDEEIIQRLIYIVIIVVIVLVNLVIRSKKKAAQQKVMPKSQPQQRPAQPYTANPQPDPGRQRQQPPPPPSLEEIFERIENLRREAPVEEAKSSLESIDLTESGNLDEIPEGPEELIDHRVIKKHELIKDFLSVQTPEYMFVFDAEELKKGVVYSEILNNKYLN